MQHPRYRYATSHAANGKKCALDAPEVHARTSKMVRRWGDTTEWGSYRSGMGLETGIVDSRRGERVAIRSRCQATRTVRRRRSRRAGFPRSWTLSSIIITRTTSYGRCQGSMETKESPSSTTTTIPLYHYRKVNKAPVGLSAADLMLKIIYHFNNNASNYINEILVPRHSV